MQLEAKVVRIHGLADEDEAQRGCIGVIEARVVRVHLDESILRDGNPDRVDPDRWRPLIMSFQRYYGLTDELHESTLAQISENLYRGPDLERARGEQRAEPSFART